MKKIVIKISHGLEWILLLTIIGLLIDFILSLIFEIEMSKLTVFTAITYSFIGYIHLGEPFEPVKVFEIAYKKIEKENFEEKSFQTFMFMISIIVGVEFFIISWLIS